MVAIATGGFTVHAGGLAYYNNPLLEVLLIPVMLAGAIPFKVFFFLYHGQVREMFRDKTVKMLLLIALAGSLLTSWDLYFLAICLLLLRFVRVYLLQYRDSVPVDCRTLIRITGL